MQCCRGIPHFNVETFLLVLLCNGVAAQLSDNDRTALIVGCVLLGAILLMCGIILCVCVCGKSKRREEQKNTFAEINSNDPYHRLPKKHLQSPQKQNGYGVVQDPQGYKVQGPSRHAGSPSNGVHLQRQVSDVERWKRFAAEREQGSRPQRSASDLRRGGSRADDHAPRHAPDSRHRHRHNSESSEVSVPPGIWTSNPTLTNGVPGPSYVVMQPNSKTVFTANGDAKNYGSEPILYTKPWYHKSMQNVRNAVKRLPTLFSGRRSSSKDKIISKNTSPTRSASHEEGPPKARVGRDGEMVARIYSNYNERRETRPVSSSSSPANRSPSRGSEDQQGSGFVAKVFSDFQVPRDYVTKERNVARVYSGYDVDGRPRSRPVSHGETSAADARQSGSSDRVHHTRSDWAVHGNKKQLERTASSAGNGHGPSELTVTVIPTTGGKKPRRSASHVVGKHDHAHTEVTTMPPIMRAQQMTSTGLSKQHSPHGHGVQMRYPTDVHAYSQKHRSSANNVDRGNRASGIGGSPGLNISKMRSAPPGGQPNSRSSTESSRTLEAQPQNKKKSLDRSRSVDPSSAHAPHAVLMHHSGSGAAKAEGNFVARATAKPQSGNRSSASGAVASAGGSVKQYYYPGPEDPDAIYTAPIRKENKRHSAPPASLEPPPVPPATDLRTQSKDGRSPVMRKQRHLTGDEETSGRKVIRDAFSFLDDFEDAERL